MWTDHSACLEDEEICFVSIAVLKVLLLTLGLAHLLAFLAPRAASLLSTVFVWKVLVFEAIVQVSSFCCCFGSFLFHSADRLCLLHIDQVSQAPEDEVVRLHVKPCLVTTQSPAPGTLKDGLRSSDAQELEG